MRRPAATGGCRSGGRCFRKVPEHLLLGKGYSLTATNFENQLKLGHQFRCHAIATAPIAGNYHNGPLSVVIPSSASGASSPFCGSGLPACARCSSTTVTATRHSIPITLFSWSISSAIVLLFLFIFGSALFGHVHLHRHRRLERQPERRDPPAGEGPGAGGGQEQRRPAGPVAVPAVLSALTPDAWVPMERETQTAHFGRDGALRRPVADRSVRRRSNPMKTLPHHARSALASLTGGDSAARCPNPGENKPA